MPPMPPIPPIPRIIIAGIGPKPPPNIVGEECCARHVRLEQWGESCRVVLACPLNCFHVASHSSRNPGRAMDPEQQKREFEDAKAKAATLLAKGDPMAAIDKCVHRNPRRAPPTEIPKRPADARDPTK